MFPRVCVNENTGIKNGDGLPYLNATIVCIIRAIVQKSWCEKNPKKWRARSGILSPPVHLIPIRSRIPWPVTGKTSICNRNKSYWFQQKVIDQWAGQKAMLTGLGPQGLLMFGSIWRSISRSVFCFGERGEKDGYRCLVTSATGARHVGDSHTSSQAKAWDRSPVDFFWRGRSFYEWQCNTHPRTRRGISHRLRPYPPVQLPTKHQSTSQHDVDRDSNTIIRIMNTHT